MAYSNAERVPIAKDMLSGLVVFLVALPLCLGIAHASGAPIMSGIIAGIIGGIVIGFLSGSNISVSGPAAGLTAIVLTQLDKLDGNYQAFLFTLVLAGLLQIVFGVLRLGSFANFVPNNVIGGLLAAIGLILIIKQFPHLIGYDMNTVSSYNLDHQSSASEMSIFSSLHFDKGAALIGLLCVGIILAWDKSRFKKWPLPSALLAVVFAAGLNYLFVIIGSSWAITGKHLINLPDVLSNTDQLFMFPDFQWSNPVIYTGAITLAIVASLETLLNLEASDKLDPRKRSSPPNRELLAQGVGNTLAGFIGGMPITSVIVRSSVNASSGARTKFSTIFHGFLLIVSVAALTPLINQIPLSALAAILILTGFKLASPQLFVKMYKEGWKQFLPFIVTVVAIITTDLLIGIIIGLMVSVAFILYSNLHRGIRVIKEHHLGGDLIRIKLGSQASFLNRASLVSTLDKLPKSENVLIDATGTDYIDPDIYQVITNFRDEEAPKRNITVSLLGFKSHYDDIDDTIQYVDVSTRELQSQLTPEQVLTVLQEGNKRFVNNERLNRDFSQQVSATSTGQHPIAAILGCIDSRAPTELIFDLGVGDVFTIRIAGNIAGQKVLGSMEFACKIKGSKLLVVLGHSDCGAVTAACQMSDANIDITQSTETPHLQYIIGPIQRAVELEKMETSHYVLGKDFIDRVTARNIQHTIKTILQNSPVLRDMVNRGQIDIIGAMYDVTSGQVNFLPRLHKSDASVGSETLKLDQVGLTQPAT